MRKLTLVIITGLPASGKTLLGNSLSALGGVRLPMGASCRGREGLCFVEVNAEGSDTDRMMREWREAGATAHLIEVKPSNLSWWTDMSAR